jgi:hypothetical protein
MMYTTVVRDTRTKKDSETRTSQTHAGKLIEEGESRQYVADLVERGPCYALPGCSPDE